MEKSSHPSRRIVAHVIYRLGTGGMENGLINLINHLPKDRYQHVIIALTCSSAFEARIDRALGVRVIALHKKTGHDWGLYWRFFRLIKRLRPEIVHTRNIGTLDLQLIAKLAGVPLRIHGEHGWTMDDQEGATWRYRVLRRAIDPLISCWVAVSAHMAIWLTDVIGIPERKVCQIYNGVDYDKFFPASDALESADAGFSLYSCTIGTVARLDPIKGLDILVDAFSKLGHDQLLSESELRLVIVGDGPERDRLIRATEALGISDRVWFAGERVDVPELLNTMDIYVSASWNEGISNTILEAMAAGRPVIATAVGGNPELVLDGETGFLVAPGDSTEMARRIGQLLSVPELRSTMGAMARNRVLTNFSLREMCKNYDQLYSNCQDHPLSQREFVTK